MNQLFIGFCVFFAAGWGGVQALAPTFTTSFSIVGVCIGWALYRLPSLNEPETMSTFFLYERKMPKKEFIGTLVTTNIGFFSSVGFSTVLVYAMGIGPALICVIAWIFGLFLFSIYIKDLLAFFRSGSTIHEYIAVRFGKTDGERRQIRFYSSIITFTLYIASVGAEIKFTADVFSPTTGMSPHALVVFLSVAGVFYVAIAGYRGVVSTDRARYWAVLSGVAAIYYFLYNTVTMSSLDLPHDYLSIRMLTIGADAFSLSSIVLLLTFYQFCVMDMWQRCIAIVSSKSLIGDIDIQAPEADEKIARELRSMLVWKSAIPFLVLFGAWYGIGLAALGQHWTEDPAKIIPEFLNRVILFSNENGLGGAAVLTLIVVCFTSAALSTIDGFLIAAVQTLVYDWRLTFSGRTKELNELNESEVERLLMLSRLLVVGCGGAAIAIALTPFGIMEFWVSMYSLMLSFFPAIILSILRGKQFCENRTAQQVSASIVLGSLSALICAILGTYLLNNSTLTSASAFLAVVISSLVLWPATVGRSS